MANRPAASSAYPVCAYFAAPNMRPGAWIASSSTPMPFTNGAEYQYQTPRDVDIATLCVQRTPEDPNDVRKKFSGFSGLSRIIFDSPGVCRLRFDTASYARAAMVGWLSKDYHYSSFRIDPNELNVLSQIGNYQYICGNDRYSCSVQLYCTYRKQLSSYKPLDVPSFHPFRHLPQKQGRNPHIWAFEYCVF